MEARTYTGCAALFAKPIMVRSASREFALKRAVVTRVDTQIRVGRNIVRLVRRSGTAWFRLSMRANRYTRHQSDREDKCEQSLQSATHRRNPTKGAEDVQQQLIQRNVKRELG